MPNADLDAMLVTLKKAAGALRDAGVPFMLGGGLAAWVRGGPESDHDLDFMLRPEDADEALDVLAAAGMRPERPPEAWLYKAWDDNDVMIDLIFEPVGLPITDETFERAEEIEVEAVRMQVMSRLQEPPPDRPAGAGAGELGGHAGANGRLGLRSRLLHTRGGARNYRGAPQRWIVGA